MGTKTRTKLYSALLSVMMLVNLVPTPAYAEGEPQPTETPVIVQTETPSAEPEANITEEPTPTPITEPTVTEEVPVIPVEGNTEPASTETPAPEQTPVSEQEETPVPEQEEKQDEESKETEADSEEDAEESEETELEETEDEEVSYPAVTLSETVDGVTVTLKAPEGSLPEGVHMTVEPVHEQAIFKAVDDTLAEEGKEIARAVAFDITLYDKDDNELQPSKYVTVSFSNTNLSSTDSDGSIDVYRVSDDASEVTPVTTIAATDNNQMFITDHFTIYLASSDKKAIHGSLEDPNGDGKNQPNGQGHRYYLEYGESITLASNESSWLHDKWYIQGVSHNGALTQVGESSTFKNTNEWEGYATATICHEYGFNPFSYSVYSYEFYYVSLKPRESFNVKFSFSDVDQTDFTVEQEGVIERNTIITPPAHESSKYINDKLYIFSGWCSDRQCTKRIPSNAFYGVRQDITAYAKYKESTDKYAIVFHGNADNCTSVPNPQYSNSNVFDNITKEYPERPGYLFAGWAATPDGKPEYSHYYYKEITIPEGRKVLDLYATWEEREAWLKYRVYDWENRKKWGECKPTYEFLNAVSGISKGSTAIPAAGYKFVRWVDKNGNTLSEQPQFIPEKTDGRYFDEVEYCAVFEPITFTVTFNTNGGNEIPSQTVNQGAYVTRPADPTKGPDTCFKFEGWYSDSTLNKQFDFNTAITSDKKLYAKWGSGNHQRDHLESREEPTCEKAGHIAGYTCVKCNKHFSDDSCTKEISDEAWVLPALGHNWEAPTYSWKDNGVEEVTASRKCSRDENHTETETLNGSQITSLEHEATCTTPGGTSYIAVFNNSAFKVQIKTVQTQPALGHEWDTPTYTWSDDNSGVVAVAHCKRDETHVEAEATTTTKVINKAATCEETGEATYTATFTKAPFNKPEYANEWVRTVSVPALGHDWNVTYSKWKDNPDGCTATATCKRNEDHTETETVSWNPVNVGATCESAGGISYVATFTKPGFGIHQDFEPDPSSKALGHDYGPARYDWNEDNSAVIAIRHCTRDYRHVAAAGVETEKTIIKDPTCTETGLANYTATFSDPYVTQTKDVDIPALGHEWGEWEVVKDPTAVEEGLKQRVCAHDNSHVETEALPKVTYSVKTGDGQTWTKGSGVTADFEFERSEENEAKKLTAYDLFTEVQIDGTKISAFKKEKGSVITKIYASYLETLSAGDHKITAKFSDGGSVTASFTVKDKEPAPTPDEKKSSGGSSTPAAPVDNVVTCQMAGYPANYSWNEAAKACQPGYIDAAGNFHPYSTRERAVPNTYDQGLAVHTWILGISALTAVFCALTLRRDSLY